MIDPVLELAGITKAYGGLRPLRLVELRLAPGESAALLGFDQPTAETFVNLATGATLPDSGDVRLFGRLTRDITDSADWLSTVDRVGIVGERAVLLDAFSPIQNLAMPFTLDIEPPPAETRRRAEALADEIGLPKTSWDRPIAELDATAWLRVRFGRAIALDPALVVLEHASARLVRHDVATVGEQFQRIAIARGIALVALTADEPFAKAVGSRVLTLDGATGRLQPLRRGWFGRSSP